VEVEEEGEGAGQERQLKGVEVVQEEDAAVPLLHKVFLFLLRRASHIQLLLELVGQAVLVEQAV
jgi:hypothetical protein